MKTRDKKPQICYFHYAKSVKHSHQILMGLSSIQNSFRITWPIILSDIKHKHTSLLNCVPCVLKTCSRANVPYVVTCSRANVPCVVTCSRANVPCVLTCSRANVPNLLTCSRANVSCVLRCSRANKPCVLTCQCALPAYVITCQHDSFDATIFSFTTIVAEVVHTVDKASELNYYLSSVTWIHM